MSTTRGSRPVLPQPDFNNDPERTLRLLMRLDDQNNVLPLETWVQCFQRRPASAPNQIIPGLYLGNLKTAAHYLLGGPHGDCKITHMLSIMTTSGTTARWNLPQAEGPGTSIKRLILNRRDTRTENILRDFDTTSKFIHEAVELYKSSGGASGGVLVHCFAGISRSSSLVIAYLLRHPENLPPMLRTMTPDKVHDTASFVRSKRSIVSPNVGFQRQLSFYSEVLDCNLWDLHSNRLKRPYLNWIRRRACIDSDQVISMILTLQWQRKHEPDDFYMHRELDR